MTKVIYRKQAEVAYITINRPEVRNAIDAETNDLLWKIWSDFRDDRGLRLAILTGAGDDAFCSGADLKSYAPLFARGGPSLGRDNIPRGLGAITRGLHRMYKPIIGAVNGWALAGGFELALACDIRIASDRAQFGSFEPRRGIHHTDGGIPRLVNICGTGVALEMLLTAEPIGAERALACNMVSRVVPHADLLPAAEEVARTILRNGQTAVESAKETILSVIGYDFDHQLSMEALLGYSLLGNPEFTKRLEQFASKTDAGRPGLNATPL